MKLGKVMGPLHLRGAELLDGRDCMLVKLGDGELAAVNRARAKAGDRVLLVTGTPASGLCMDAPVDAVIVAVVDENTAGSDIPARAVDKSVEDTFQDALESLRGPGA